MAVSRLRTDPTTRSELGPEIIADLKVTLWPEDCQSCGRRFRRWTAPALEVCAHDGHATASLHHRRCQPAVWRNGLYGAATGRGHLTWRAGCFLDPVGLPFFVVNPSYEAALLRQDENGNWRVATLDPLLALGLEQELSAELVPVPALAATIDGDRISVVVRDDDTVLYSWHDIPLPADVSEVVRKHGQIMVAATTIMDVRKKFALEGFRALVGVGGAVLGLARLASVSFPARFQTLRTSDHPREYQDEAFSLGADAIAHAHGIMPGDTVRGAAIALCEGEDRPIRQLTGTDKLGAVFLVSYLFALLSRGKLGEPTRGPGVHVITSDDRSADEYRDFFAPAIDLLAGISVARLGGDPTSEEGSEAFLADIVVGTGEDFAAADAAYRDRGQAWDVHAGRGQLAIVAEGDRSPALSKEFIQRYPNVAVV